jgi:hypothetical protein
VRGSGIPRDVGRDRIRVEDRDSGRDQASRLDRQEIIRGGLDVPARTQLFEHGTRVGVHPAERQCRRGLRDQYGAVEPARAKEHADLSFVPFSAPYTGNSTVTHLNAIDMKRARLLAERRARTPHAARIAARYEQRVVFRQISDERCRKLRRDIVAARRKRIVLVLIVGLVLMARRHSVGERIDVLHGCQRAITGVPNGAYHSAKPGSTSWAL